MCICACVCACVCVCVCVRVCVCNDTDYILIKVVTECSFSDLLHKMRTMCLTDHWMMDYQL